MPEKQYSMMKVFFGNGNRKKTKTGKEIKKKKKLYEKEKKKMDDKEKMKENRVELQTKIFMHEAFITFCCSQKDCVT